MPKEKSGIDQRGANTSRGEQDDGKAKSSSRRAVLISSARGQPTTTDYELHSKEPIPEMSESPNFFSPEFK